ncbi:class I SAM-dependent methyltransferase [Nocardioides insulae]|uniref:class I SAM-dependent methyltransferase n=1 Tax=Nocardioides insulae TaxID=394734 RepID=UPI00040F0AB5|nr:class I SAM-dependent methyltransferase [Nocardioides insulae]
MDSSAWDERYAGTDLVWSVTPNVFVADRIAELPPARAVDLAAGEGRNAIWLASRGWEVTAVDFSTVGLDKGRRLAEHRETSGSLSWVTADATTWRSPEPVDLVVVAYLQLPAAERARAARAAFAALAPGGHLLWVAHDLTNLTEGTGGPQDPAVLMTADDVLADLAEEADAPGYRVLEADRVARRVPARPEDGHGEAPGLTAWDCLVHLERSA